MNKRVSLSARPQTSAHSADDWVSRREIPANVESVKRLTIDINKSLHTAIKTECARQGVNMADAIRALLEKHFLNGGMAPHEPEA